MLFKQNIEVLIQPIGLKIVIVIMRYYAIETKAKIKNIFVHQNVFFLMKFRAIKLFCYKSHVAHFLICSRGDKTFIPGYYILQIKYLKKFFILWPNDNFIAINEEFVATLFVFKNVSRNINKIICN